MHPAPTSLRRKAGAGSGSYIITSQSKNPILLHQAQILTHVLHLLRIGLVGEYLLESRHLLLHSEWKTQAYGAWPLKAALQGLNLAASKSALGTEAAQPERKLHICGNEGERSPRGAACDPVSSATDERVQETGLDCRRTRRHLGLRVSGSRTRKG